MTPYLGQLLLAAWGFAAKGWAQCNGQLYPINQNAALFSLLGTFYGGDGIRTFALPNLQGRTPIAFSSSIPIGTAGGEASHTLSVQEVPNHTHTISAVTAATSDIPDGAFLAGNGLAAFNGASNLANMNGSTLAPYGGSQPHENRQPYLVMNWCIALNGIFPSQN